MKNFQTNLRKAALLGFAIPTVAAFGQYTGTSHPESVPVTTSPDGVRQPLVYADGTQAQGLPQGYVPTPPPAAPRTLAAQPTSASTDLRVRPEPIPATTADGMVVGDALPGTATQGVPSEFPADIDDHIVTRLEGPANALPVGTLIKTRLLDELSTKSTAEGSEWQAELIEPLTRDGKVLIPAGSILRGKVTEVVGGKRINGQAAIHLTTIAVVLPDGSTRGLHAQVIDTSLYHQTKVDSEGTILHRSNKKMEAGVLGLTTGSGAAAGALIAGVPGALVGAGVGAGVSTAIWLKQDHQTYLPRHTEIIFELNRAISFSPE
jgi:hypothetical protein